MCLWSGGICAEKSDICFSQSNIFSKRFLWPPCIADADVISLSCFFFFSSPNLSGRRMDVYHTSTHDVVLVRIWNAGLKCATRGSLEMQNPKKSPKIGHLGTIAQLRQAIYLRK